MELQHWGKNVGVTRFTSSIVCSEVESIQKNGQPEYKQNNSSNFTNMPPAFISLFSFSTIPLHLLVMYLPGEAPEIYNGKNAYNNQQNHPNGRAVTDA